MYDQIETALVSGIDAPADLPRPSIDGKATAPSVFETTDLVQAAVGAAVSAVQALRRELWNTGGTARLDRNLVNLWCAYSAYPQGWDLPSIWDPFAGDYLATDGWIRLHTNAPHHRTAALQILGNPAHRADLEAAVAGWQAEALETAVVAAGGCAAAMRGTADWAAHPQGAALAEEPIVAWKLTGTDAPGFDLVDAARPLAGLRVLDLTRVLAGPVCTRFLAGLGADVLRVDPPHWEEDAVAIEMTMGKRCAGLDLRTEADRDVLAELITQADLMVHGYRADALERLGFGAARRQALNPGLIDVALNAYGWTGPWAFRRGFDSLVQMSTGIAQAGMDAAGADRPVPLPFQALDHATGYLMAAAALHAIRARACSGQVLAARLSLARQAVLLTDYPAEGSNAPVPALEPDSLEDRIEATDWGPVKRLRVPFEIEGVAYGWTRPARRFRSDPPRWD